MLFYRENVIKKSNKKKYALHGIVLQIACLF